MAFYVCSCGLLFGERIEVFDQYCKIKGHTLFEVSAELYRVIYGLNEANITLKDIVHKRNRNITVLKDRIQVLTTELDMIKSV
jgi:hypothetical protein